MMMNLDEEISKILKISRILSISSNPSRESSFSDRSDYQGEGGKLFHGKLETRRAK